MKFYAGEMVKIVGEKNKIYRVHAAPDETYDGSVLLYGGSTNPNKKRGYRSVMPDRLVKVKPKG